jgi:hypothetical protein
MSRAATHLPRAEDDNFHIGSRYSTIIHFAP